MIELKMHLDGAEEPRHGTAKDGRDFTTRRFYLATDEQYPSSIIAEVFLYNDSTDPKDAWKRALIEYDPKQDGVGKLYRFGLEFRTREYNGKRYMDCTIRTCDYPF